MYLWSLSAVVAALTLTSAAPTPPTAQLSSGGVITGGVANSTEYFRGIPFAEPPVNGLRFKPPQAYTGDLDGFQATEFGARCILQSVSTASSYSSMPESIQPLLTEYFATAPGGNYSEDCLTLSVYRPPGTNASASLPVMYWIYGGSFTGGFQDKYDPELIIQQSVVRGQPVIVVTMNYRLGVYGWLGGQQVLDDGPGNWGLLDQRLGMEWVADNIAGFGGDPGRVTIFGESAGSISVGHHLFLNDGNNTYKGQPLFHGAIMESGSFWNTKSINSTRPQLVFDAVAVEVGCALASDVLECMRGVDVETMNTVQGNISLPLTFGPRYDYQTLTQQPYELAAQGKYAHVPFIIGDQTDEGTLFALDLSIVSIAPTFALLLEYLYPDASILEIATFTALYLNIASEGSPFGTGDANELYFGYKRNSAFLGDSIFQWPRRYLLQHTTEVESWSYLCDAFRGTPYLGTFHGTDVGLIFETVNPVANAMRNYWISFANTLNPNNDAETNWPQYSDGGYNLNISANALTLLADDYRESASEYFVSNVQDLWN